MALQIVLGVFMTGVTIAFGSAAIVFGAEQLKRRMERLGRELDVPHQIFALTLVALSLVIAMLLLMVAWAVVLLLLGALPGFEAAFYFSMVSFTTLGFGDLLLQNEWRLLAGFIAVDGFLLFGLNTAFIFEVLRRLGEHAKDARPR